MLYLERNPMRRLSIVPMSSTMTAASNELRGSTGRNLLSGSPGGKWTKVHDPPAVGLVQGGKDRLETAPFPRRDAGVAPLAACPVAEVDHQLHVQDALRQARRSLEAQAVRAEARDVRP